MRDPRRTAPGAARRRWPGAQCTSARRPRSGAAGRPAPWPRSGSVQRGHSNRRPCARGRRRQLRLWRSFMRCRTWSMSSLHQSRDGRALHGRRRLFHGRIRRRYTFRGSFMVRRTSKPTAFVGSNGWRNHCATGVIVTSARVVAWQPRSACILVRLLMNVHARGDHGIWTCTYRTPNRP